MNLDKRLKVVLKRDLAPIHEPCVELEEDRLQLLTAGKAWGRLESGAQLSIQALELREALMQQP